MKILTEKLREKVKCGIVEGIKLDAKRVSQKRERKQLNGHGKFAKQQKNANMRVAMPVDRAQGHNYVLRENRRCLCLT
jgi:hypothetical protein